VNRDDVILFALSSDYAKCAFTVLILRWTALRETYWT